MLRMIPDGETFSASDVMDKEDANKWVSRFSFRLTKGGSRYEKLVNWDFTKCSREDLIRLAFYDLRVWVQAQLRSAGRGAIDNEKLFATVDVLADRINATRAPVDPVERAVRSLMQLGYTEADARAVAAMAPSATPATPVADEAQDADAAEEMSE